MQKYVKNSVPIVFAADDGYAMPTAVAITSLLENKKKKTFYKIYILTPGLSEKHYKKPDEYKDLTLRQTFLIGLSQALAIIPGFSRSGTTILASRLMGVSREGAAKFTFLLSTPIIFGAAIVKVGDLMTNFNIAIIVGVITSAVVGVLSIKFLLKYIKNNDFAIFAYYRVFIALIVIIKLILT